LEFKDFKASVTIFFKDCQGNHRKYIRNTHTQKKTIRKEIQKRFMNNYDPLHKNHHTFMQEERWETINEDFLYFECVR
jgi:hypothetical protein